MEEEMANLKEHSKELKVENEELEEEREKLAKKIRDLLRENSELKNDVEKSKGSLQKLEVRILNYMINRFMVQKLMKSLLFQQKCNQMKKSLIDNKTEKIFQLTSEIEYQKSLNSQVQQHCDNLVTENKGYQDLLHEQAQLIKQLNVRALYLIMFSSLVACIFMIIWILWDLVGSINLV